MATADPKIDTPIITPDQEQQLAPQPKGPRVPVAFGMRPTTIDEAFRMATAFSTSDLVPKTFRGRPADILVAMQLGAELGLAPMQALQSIAVINGRPSIWGDGLLALIMASPLYVDHTEYFEVDGQQRDGLVVDDLKKDTTAAVCTFVRHHKATPVTRRFSIAQAKKAGLLGKEGAWQGFPDRMLAMRARGFAARDAFPDLLRGLKAAEEVQDIEDDDEAPIPPPAEVRRISQTPPPTAPAPSTNATPTLTNATPTLTIGPVAVAAVTPFLGGYVVQLQNGTALDTFNDADAADLDKVTTSGHRYTFVCERGDVDGAHPVIQSFTIAD